MNNILEFVLNTPEKYWTVIGSVHLKKAFWGFLCLLISTLLFCFFQNNENIIYLGLSFFILGCILIVSGVLGNIYTHNAPYFRLWQPYP